MLFAGFVVPGTLLLMLIQQNAFKDELSRREPQAARNFPLGIPSVTTRRPSGARGDKSRPVVVACGGSGRVSVAGRRPQRGYAMSVSQLWQHCPQYGAPTIGE
jgi:hypothetical protein